MRFLASSALAVFCVLGTACGPPPLDREVMRPSALMNFEALYSSNCAGCHGRDGKGGIAVSLGDPVYLAIADDATISRVTSNGVPGTSMPAFAEKAGGFLTEAQLQAITSGIREKWGKADALHGANPPPYSAQTPGDAKRGAAAYATYCSSCHGTDGRGTAKGSSIVNSAYLGLVSDQGLRTTVIVGRPEMGAPDWREDVPGKPMSNDDISDVVAWLASQRPQFSNAQLSLTQSTAAGAKGKAK